MIPFIAAFAVFLLLHSVPALPVVRSGIIARVGRHTYFVAYSLASTVALIWVFSAALSLDYIPVWDSQPWHAGVAFVLAPIGGFLVLAGLLSVNPLSVAIRASGSPGAILCITRHPVLWGFAFWAVGHLVANGDLRSLLLFGGFALFAIGSIPMADKRARRRLGAAHWAELSKGTSAIPAASIFAGERFRIDLPMLASGALAALAVFWLLFAGGHALLFGADPVSIFG